MPHLREMTGIRQHREHRLDPHPHIPLPSLADLHAHRIARRSMEYLIGQHDHLLSEPLDPRMEGAVMNIRGGTIPLCDQADLLEHKGEFAPDDPADD